MMLGFWRRSNVYSITFLTVLACSVADDRDRITGGKSLLERLIQPAIQCLLRAWTRAQQQRPAMPLRHRALRIEAQLPALCRRCQCFPTRTAHDRPSMVRMMGGKSRRVFTIPSARRVDRQAGRATQITVLIVRVVVLPEQRLMASGAQRPKIRQPARRWEDMNMVQL